MKKAFGLSLHSFPVQRRKCGPAEGRHHRDASEEKGVQSLCDLVTLPQHLFSRCAGENLFSRECVSVSACVCVCGGDVLTHTRRGKYRLVDRDVSLELAAYMRRRQAYSLMNGTMRTSIHYESSLLK